MDLAKLEKISDYSLELMEEIERDIKMLSHLSWPHRDNTLEEINNKIYLARTNWVNVNVLDKQILEFRIILFKRDIENKIDEINENLNTYVLNIDNITEEYKKITEELDIKSLVLEELMFNLNIEVTRWKIKLMILDIKESDWASVYTIDQVVNEIDIAKRKGINIDDIEAILFD